MIRPGRIALQIASVRHHDHRGKEDELRDGDLEYIRKLERPYTDKWYVNKLSSQASCARDGVQMPLSLIS